MANVKNNAPLELRTETIHPTGPSDDHKTITIINDIQSDALIYFNNKAWGNVSLGYARVGKSVALPSNVHVDAYVLFEADEGVFLHWPNPWTVEITYTVKKIDLTPGETYRLSDFGATADAVGAAAG